MSPIKTLTDMPVLKMVAVVLSLVGTVGGFIWAAEEHFLSEAEAGVTMKLMQQSIEMRITESEHRVKMIQYDGLSDRYWRLREIVTRDPNNEAAREELREVTIKRDNLRRELGL